MKPLNLDNRPCSPISSNCVIWQGPDIPCIKLCTGDSVSDVVFKLGTELCTIMDQLDVTNYDLSCLGINSCPPEDFHALIQLLIDRLCEANGVAVTPEKSLSGCPDCVVTVAPCFVVGNQTTMQLVDYVQMVANRVCSILDQISVINNQITSLDNRVTVLENTPPPTFTLPSIDTACLATYMGNIATAPIDQVLDTLVSNSSIGYCSLIQATGLPADILSAVASQCVSSTDDSLASLAAGDSPVEPMSTYYNGTWINSPANVADAITNLWISLCDIRSYIENSVLNVADTTTVDLTYTAGTLTADVVDTGWQNLLGFDYYTGTMATQKPQARRIGKVIHFRGNVFVPLEDPTKLGNVVNLATSSTYYDVQGCSPYDGIGGVFVDPDDQSIFFNGNASVIPTSVLAAGPTDGVYTMGFVIGVRPIELTSTKGTSLTSSFVVGITTDKKLYISTLKDLENISTLSPNNVTGGAPLRYITSNVIAGDYVPNFINAASYVNSVPATGVNNIVTETEFPGPLDLQWTFDCDAGKASNLGGFSFRIDGLMSYIS